MSLARPQSYISRLPKWVKQRGVVLAVTALIVSGVAIAALTIILRTLHVPKNNPARIGRLPSTLFRYADPAEEPSAFFSEVVQINPALGEEALTSSEGGPVFRVLRGGMWYNLYPRGSKRSRYESFLGDGRIVAAWAPQDLSYLMVLVRPLSYKSNGLRQGDRVVDDNDSRLYVVDSLVGGHRGKPTMVARDVTPETIKGVNVKGFNGNGDLVLENGKKLLFEIKRTKNVAK